MVKYITHFLAPTKYPYAAFPSYIWSTWLPVADTDTAVGAQVRCVQR